MFWETGWRELSWAMVSVAVAVVLALGVRYHLAQVYVIESSSMAPTLHEGDRVLVEKVTHRLHGTTYGDIVVFLPDAAPTGGRPAPVIKRVAGVAGDRIGVVGGQLVRNGVPQSEPWALLAADTPYPESVVPEGTVFLLGDNRAFSLDSRSGLGPVPLGQVVGRARWRLFPSPTSLAGAEALSPQAHSGTLRP